MKKMRRLIPAIAMLLVSAVMLSTASFAWFTMNEAVTATGMQVKAKASGNLLISESKMTAANQDITVGLTNRGTHTDIIPVTYTTEWQVPNDSSKVDPLYGGLLSGNGLKTADKTLAYTTSPYFIDYTVYVATAGDENEMKAQNLYVTMNMISAAEDIAKAYSIAFYVGEPAEGQDLGAFAGYINYKTFADAAGTKVYLNGTYDIPSTFEKNADNAVGLRITMRVFVDGALPSGTAKPETPDYQPAPATYGTGDTLKYYEKVGTTYVLLDKTLWTSTTDTSAYFTWDGTSMVQGDDVTTYYVNNADIPTGATTFDVTIGSTATVPTGAVTTKGTN